MERKVNLQKVLIGNYMPYGVSTVVERALCRIDGFKPVQRRIIYSMDKDLHLLSKNASRAKSLRAVGQTSPYHPHGDSSIYGALANMTPQYESYNLPYIDGKGQFGKVYHSLGPAAMRYTEAKLLPICAELLDGLNENAVDMVPTDDNKDIEPVVLPVKFPSVLVNSSPGIAVGYSSNLPQFPLDRVCLSTLGMLKGEIKNASELADVLGIPEYPTGCHVHADKALLTKLCETGKAKVYISGTMIPYKDKLEIVEIPPNTKAEEIIKEIEDLVKNDDKSVKSITELVNAIDKDGFKIVVKVKRGTDVRALGQALLNKTSLRCSTSYLTRIIIDNRPKDLGLFELLQHWIEFRDTTISRIYRFRLGKKLEEEKLMSCWEILKGHMKEVVDIAIANKRAEAAKIISEKFKLTEEQSKYVLDFKIWQLTEDEVEKSLKELQKKRDEIKEIIEILSDVELRKNIMISEITDIMKKYSTKNKTTQLDVIDENKKVEKEQISSEVVRVVITKKGYIRRVMSNRETVNLDDDDFLIRDYSIKNDSHILVFTYSGEVHKILVDSIDASKKMKDTIQEMLGLNNSSEILYIDTTEDYTKSLVLLYENGKLSTVPYNKFSGNRQKYINAYESAEVGRIFIPASRESLVITLKHKVSMINLNSLGSVSKTTSNVKLLRLESDDIIVGLIKKEDLIDEVKNDASILNSFNKVNPVKTKKVLLFNSPKKVYTGSSDTLSFMVATKVAYDMIKELEVFYKNIATNGRATMKDLDLSLKYSKYFESEEYIENMKNTEDLINEFRTLINS